MIVYLKQNLPFFWGGGLGGGGVGCGVGVWNLEWEEMCGRRFFFKKKKKRDVPPPVVAGTITYVTKFFYGAGFLKRYGLHKREVGL